MTLRAWTSHTNGNVNPTTLPPANYKSHMHRVQLLNPIDFNIIFNIHPFLVPDTDYQSTANPPTLYARLLHQIRCFPRVCDLIPSLTVNIPLFYNSFQTNRNFNLFFWMPVESEYTLVWGRTYAWSQTNPGRWQIWNPGFGQWLFKLHHNLDHRSRLLDPEEPCRYFCFIQNQESFFFFFSIDCKRLLGMKIFSLMNAILH